jgi:hypothetical protein
MMMKPFFTRGPFFPKRLRFSMLSPNVGLNKLSKVPTLISPEP